MRGDRVIKTRLEKVIISKRLQIIPFIELFEDGSDKNQYFLIFLKADVF